MAHSSKEYMREYMRKYNRKREYMRKYNRKLRTLGKISKNRLGFLELEIERLQKCLEKALKRS